MATEETPVFAELRETDLFSGLQSEQLCGVMKSARRQQYEAGRTLFTHGEPAEYCYWLRRGQIKLYRVSSSGNEKVIELLGSGEHVAEALVGALVKGHYPVTAQTLRPSEVWRFEVRALLDGAAHSPEMALRMVTVLSRRMYSLIDEIDLLSLQSATTRVVDFLLQESARGGGHRVALRTTKHLLAARLSIKPETLSRIFGRLTHDGLISVRKGEVLLRDPNALQAYSNTGVVQ